MLTFQRFDAAGCDFPPPRVPLLPVLRARDLKLRRNNAAASLRGPGVRHFSRGRYALRAAYQAAGVGAHGALLAPAYHCRTMLDPALALHAPISLYAVDALLRPDLDAIRAAMARAPVKALLVPHYFGFAQPAETMSALAQLCHARGVTLIEDCSHSWQIALDTGPRSSSQAGRMVVASPYKFFPCPDGGTLWADPAQLGSVAVSAPVEPVSELKALGKLLRRYSAAVGPGAPGAHAARGTERIESGELMSIHYQRVHEGPGGLALSRWIVQHVSQDDAAARRRINYQRWLDAASSLRGARALFGNLPAECTPYMFPLLLEAPDPHFFQLKQLGLPIWRWDDMAVSDCGVAATMRLHLLHLPCHQSLSDAQMEWMIGNLTQVLTA